MDIAYENMKEKSRDDQERLLWKASKEYLLGQITVNEFEDIESIHNKKVKEGFIELAKRQIKNKFSS